MGIGTEKIRTIAIAGHGQSGKTTLIENLAALTGTIARAEPVSGGKTLSDYTPEEIERKISIYSALVSMNWNDTVINFWDTPGSSDFMGEVIAAFRSAETGLMVLDAKSGVQIETIKYWRDLDRRNKPRLVFVNKMDEDRADFNHSMQDVKTQFKADVFAVTFPIGKGADLAGIVDVLHGVAYQIDSNGKEKEIPIPDEAKKQYEEMREVLAGAAAEGDEDLLVKFIDEGELSSEEIAKGLTLAMRNNRIVPIFAGAAQTGLGLTALLRFITEILPSPAGCLERAVKDGEECTIKIDPEPAFSGFIVKTANDQFSGRLSYIKVITGTLVSDAEVYNINEQKKERVGKLYRAAGKKLTEVKELVAGDVGVAVKLAAAKTNDTLAASQDCRPFVKLRNPDPIYSLAVAAVDKKNDDKLGEQLLRACEEDMTLSFVYNAETKQNVFSGMGDLHTSIVLDRIKKQTKIEIQTSIPRIAYRETIRQKAQAEYTHKKQSGGHGQFGRVVLAIEPLERGAKYSFTNAVFGGAISKGYIPGVEKGVKEAMENGVMAGYPVVDVGTTVLDGKEHPVDSSEMAFKIAARNAFKNAMRNAGPILLEPIMNLTVYVETAYLGDIMSDLSSRRGRILGQSQLANGIEEIRAQVPHKELLRYAIDLRSMTSGTGSFEMSFDHYDPISGKIADEVVAAAKAFIEEQEE
ncbi:putative translation elongation factor G [Treponema vincentii ATCC 35580]|uniref:Elongation factor G n=1 Tax=Treponema vincentii ATCC 35580 TaxID=596324 RepID=C8PM17_9SPIR|nr:elongation factor G [Treponema vincentii]EEV21526.1 putative translation elongation factor G [Treponema vincentii ATCC 35580]